MAYRSLGFIGYYPSLNAVIVSNEGTSAIKVSPIMVDADARLRSLSPKLFPNISSSVKIHAGFQGRQRRSAVKKLMAVKLALVRYKTTRVALTGHSLGAAISLIDSLYMTIHIPAAKIKVITYGMPRVGNQDFADLIDKMVPRMTRINNQRDFVPIIPAMGLDYRHPSGEIHIVSPGNWAACKGQENNNTLCTVGAVPNIWAGSVRDHLQFYDGIHISDC